MFLAAPLPAHAAGRVWDALEPVRARHQEVRWILPESLHLTLVFLGSTEPASVPQIDYALRNVAAATQACGVTLGAAGGRIGRRHGGVAWLQVVDRRQLVTHLAQALDERLPSLRHGQINPVHLTVARAADEALLKDLRQSGPAAGVGWTVDRIALWRSHTRPRGAFYEELAAATLGG